MSGKLDCQLDARTYEMDKSSWSQSVCDMFIPRSTEKTYLLWLHVFPETNFVPVTHTQIKNRLVEIVITTYETFRLDFDTIFNEVDFDCVFFDEVHKIKEKYVATRT